MYDYPRFKIYDDLYIYYNKWEVAPLSETTDDPKFCNKDLVDVEKNNFKIENINLYAPEDVDVSVDMVLSNTPLRNETTREIQDKCLFITSLIKKYEGLLYNAYISRLYPGCEIKPHVDRHVNLLRFHLGIQTDPNCKLTVGSETKRWKEGDFLVFNHGGKQPHSVKHLGKKPRIIFSFDLPLHHVMEY
jgi:quercetin dioxygenase-like cupin family protein